jgi:hypothetical protein
VDGSAANAGNGAEDEPFFDAYEAAALAPASAHSAVPTSGFLEQLNLDRQTETHKSPSPHRKEL